MQFRLMLKSCPRHPLKGIAASASWEEILRDDPGHAGGTTSPTWPRSSLGCCRMSYREFMGKSVLLYKHMIHNSKLIVINIATQRNTFSTLQM